jgi:hypothetical protein
MDAPHPPSAAHPAPDPHGNDAPPAVLLEQVADRLRPVRGQMDAAHFHALVLDVARFTLRWGETRRPPQ